MAYARIWMHDINDEAMSLLAVRPEVIYLVPIGMTNKLQAILEDVKSGECDIEGAFAKHDWSDMLVVVHVEDLLSIEVPGGASQIEMKFLKNGKNDTECYSAANAEDALRLAKELTDELQGRFDFSKRKLTPQELMPKFASIAVAVLGAILFFAAFGVEVPKNELAVGRAAAIKGLLLMVGPWGVAGLTALLLAALWVKWYFDIQDPPETSSWVRESTPHAVAGA